MLLPQGLALFFGEVAHAQRLGLDVEGTAASDHLSPFLVQAVIPYIAHTTQHDALGEGIRSLRIAGADLAQQRDQGVAHQGVHFVQEQYRGAIASKRPCFQQMRQQILGVGVLMLPQPATRSVVAQIVVDGSGNGAAGCMDAERRVATRGLGALDIGIGTGITTLRIDRLHHRQQRGGLACLPWSVEHEIPLLLDQCLQILPVDATQRINGIVIGRDRGSGIVEETRHNRSIGRNLSGKPMPAYNRQGQACWRKRCSRADAGAGLPTKTFGTALQLHALRFSPPWPAPTVLSP